MLGTALKYEGVHHLRRAGWLILLCLACIICPPLAAADGPQVVVAPATLTIEAGSEAIVTVEVSGSGTLYGFELHLRFDPAVLQVIDADSAKNGIQVQPGNLLTGKQTFVAQNVADNVKGSIDYAVTLMGEREGVSKDGSAIVIRFQGRAAGVSEITFAQDPPSQLADPGGRAINVSLQGGKVTVTGVPGTSPTSTVASTPVPTSTQAATTTQPAATSPASTAATSIPTRQATAPVPASQSSTATLAASATSRPTVATPSPAATVAPSQPTRPLEPQATVQARPTSQPAGEPPATPQPTAAIPEQARLAGVGVVIAAVGLVVVVGGLGGLYLWRRSRSRRE